MELISNEDANQIARKAIQDLLPPIEELNDMCACRHTKGLHTPFDLYCTHEYESDIGIFEKCACEKFNMDNFWYIENKVKP